MNTVFLKAWTVLNRRGSTVSVYNYENSKTYFDEFEFTGMNNFDFFATDYLRQRYKKDEKTGSVRRRSN